MKIDISEIAPDFPEFRVAVVAPTGCGSPLNELDVLIAEHCVNHRLSTFWRQTGIVMNVQSVPRGITDVSKLSFLGRGRTDNLLKAHI